MNEEPVCSNYKEDGTGRFFERECIHDINHSYVPVSYNTL